MKFKSVNIVGFRAYAQEGDGFFDFHNKKGDIANFVSIYAPNGFGKSSFYDAMEWSITNNISRYIRDSLRVINQGTSKNLNSEGAGQRILRNRYISGTDPSYVDVKATDDFNFKKEVKKPRKGARDYTYDPADTNEENKNLIDIFLSQDAIDSFLKEERPELRYDKFMSVFGGSDEKYRKKLSSILKICQKECQNLTSEINDLKSKIHPPELDFSIDKVNQSIDKLNNDMGFNFIDKIENSFNEFNSIELKTKINKEIFNIQQNILTFENYKNEVLSTIEKIPNLLKLKNEINKKDKVLNKLKINKEKILELERVKDNIEKIEVEKKILNSELQDFHFMQDKIHDLLSSISNLKSLDKKILESNNAIKNINTKMVDINNELIDSINSLNLENSTLSDLKNKLGKVDFQFSLIENNEKILKDNQNKILDLQSKNSNNYVSLNLLHAQLNKYSNIDIGEKILLNETSLLLKPQNDFLVNFNNSFNIRSSLIDEIADLKNEIDILSIKENTISDLALKISTIVNESKLETCPICKTKHESFDQLINKIIDNSSSSNHLNLLRKTILEKENILNDINNFIHDGIIHLNNLKNTLVDNINSKIKKINSEIFESDSSIIILNKENKKVDLYLNSLKSETLNLSKSEFIKNLDHKIKNTTSNIENLNKKIYNANNITKEYKNNISFEKSKLNKFELEVLKYTTTQLYTIYTNIKKIYPIPEGFENNFFSEKINFLSFKLNELKSDLSSLNKISSDIDLFLSNNDHHKSIFTIENEIKLNYDEISVFSASCNEITSLIGKYIDVNNKNYNYFKFNLNIKIKDFEDNISTLTKNLLNLKTLDFQISQTMPYLIYLDAQKDINKKELRLINLNSLIIKIKLDLDAINHRLLSKIDNFFYTKLINKIYKKIDPHPFFKHVKFECVFNEDEKPRLEVYLYEKDSHSPISPSLYFSSAQLNILSLSIFLARALHVEHKGKPVNAILIDDPIQSMDSINVLATIDLLRNISKKFDKQIILSTHDENFHELLKLKLSEAELGAKFITFSSYGKVVQD